MRLIFSFVVLYRKTWQDFERPINLYIIGL